MPSEAYILIAVVVFCASALFVVKLFIKAPGALIKDTSDSTGNLIRSVGDTTVSTLQGTGETVGTLLKDTGETAGSLIKDVGEAICTVLSSCGSAVKEIQESHDSTHSASLTVIHDSTKPELITITRTFDHVYVYKNTKVGSTKVLILKARYEAKAGIELDIKHPIAVNIEGSNVQLSNVRGTLISCSKIGEVEELYSGHGLINQVDKDDMRKSIHALNEDAKRYILETNILQEAEFSCLQLIKSSMAHCQIKQEPQRIPHHSHHSIPTHIIPALSERETGKIDN